MNMTMLKFSQEVAKAIGNVDPSIVYEIIKISNDRRYIFHGIKRNNSFGSINEEGVKPLTPEGGWASYWTSGRAIFGSRFNRLITEDTPFFDYAHSYDFNSNSLDSMNLAVANYDCLESKIGIKDSFCIDGYFKIHITVPRDFIHLIRIETKRIGSDMTERQYGQRKERLLLNSISSVLKKDYKPGGLTLVKT